MIKENIRMPEDKFKKAAETMWNLAGIPGKTKQDSKLKYLVLFKDTKTYEAV